ncbi:MAG TPA: hypothetical protein VEI52_12770, partial [Terriglobales bacterium]|nr:hypothetical protein [Terriglobales bacterium]
SVSQASLFLYCSHLYNAVSWRKDKSEDTCTGGQHGGQSERGALLDVVISPDYSGILLSDCF